MLVYVEGIDFKDELVIVIVYYDYVGCRGNFIFNGVDDNGLGILIVLEVV